MLPFPLLALYSLAHFWVDLSCALLLFRNLLGSGEWMLCVLLYNFCAFALQMPLGALADRLSRNGLLAASGCVLVAAAYLSPWGVLTAVTAGVGNALFHLGGGVDVLNRSEKRCAALGVFVSPGAFGLYLGTAWGKGVSTPLFIGPAVLLVLAAAILSLSRRCFGSLRSENVPFDTAAPGGLWPMAPLFLVVVLRSYMGMNQAFSWKGAGHWALALTAALVLGKCAGGFLADRMGAVRASNLSLGLAAALYLLSALPLPGTLAVFCFNMTMPITLWAVAQVMPGAKGFTFGLLTFALFLGFLPSWMGWPSLLTGPLAYAAVALVSMGLMRLGLKGVGRC